MTLPVDRLERLSALEGSHFWSVGRDRLVDNLMARYDMSPPFLDAGAGTGAFASRFGSDWFWLDTGEVTEGGVRASVTEMPFADQSMGAVLMRDVLEHVDDRIALEESLRVLRPGGHLLVTVPGWPSLWGPRDRLAGHLRRYRRSGLRRLVERAGFEVLEIRGYQFLLLPGVVAVRVAASISGQERPEREENVGRFNPFLARVNLFEANMARRRHPAPPTGSSLVLIGLKA